MGCLVKSGGCERAATEPFIQHLNRARKSRYMYEACLDVDHRETPQPETLYVDRQGNKSLVVETKSLFWPPNYAQGHAHDHFLADEISNELAEIDFRELYCLRLPWLISGTKTELRAFARRVAADVKARYRSLKHAQSIGSRQIPGRFWMFYIQPEEERDEDGPTAGIVYSWTHEGEIETLISPIGPPPELKDELSSIYDSCMRKFVGYPESRRILLLHPYGDLTCFEAWWWQRIFTACPPPRSIDEIWQGSFDEETRTWEFECLVLPDKLLGGSTLGWMSSSPITRV